jgi:hypothetical protein
VGSEHGSRIRIIESFLVQEGQISVDYLKEVYAVLREIIERERVLLLPPMHHDLVRSNGVLSHLLPLTHD